MKKIIFKFLFTLLGLSIAILFIGLFETIRFQFMFGITEQYLMTPELIPEEILTDYYDFRNSYIFTNDIFITVMNFISLVLLFYLMLNSWKVGRNSAPYKLTDIFNKYGLLMILSFYFVGILFDYVKDIFLSQIILILFNDIYINFYMYHLFVEYFFYLLLLAYGLSYLSNQLKYFDIIN